MKAKIFLLVVCLFIIYFLAGNSDAENHFLCIKSGEMVKVSAGEFMMGCNASVDGECYDDEKPYHKVYLDTYYIDKFEVTVDQYKACVNAGKCTEQGITQWDSCNNSNPDRGNHAINCVDWNQAQSYCSYAGKRLPTEAEWEKAARGTDERKYPWGNQKVNCSFAILSEGGDGCGRNSTWPVGSKPSGASPYGAMDMVGNVWEWTVDWEDGKYYSISPARNPQGPDSGSYRVLRGGSWDNDNPRHFRASNRSSNKPSIVYARIGFRCAKTP